MPITRTVHRTCHLCEAMCGLVLDVDDTVAGGAVVAARGDQNDALGRGHICPKGAAIGDGHSDPDRLRHPVRRTPTGWAPIPWEEALDMAADGLRRVQEQYGKDAVAVYLGNPTVHSHGSLFLPLLLKAVGTHNLTSASTVDQRPHEVVSWAVLGHSALIPVPDLDRTDHLLIIGANPLASNGSLMTAGDTPGRLRDIRDRGGRIVVLDPRRTETAHKADEYVPVRPGTDPLLLAALLQVIFDEGLDDPGPLADHVDGLAEVARLVATITPERAAGPTGVDASTIRRLARDFASADRAAAYCRIGTSHQRHATVATWLVLALNVVTGNLDRAGGVMLPTPAFDLVAMTSGGARGRWASRVLGLPEFGGELPVSILADEMTTPGDGQVRAVLVNAGNPVLSTPGGHRLDEALADLDFMVAIDLYVTETTRHADVILPPVGALERSHYDHAFHNLAVRNTARWSPPVFPAPDEQRHDWEVFADLAMRLFRDPDRATTIARRYGDVADVDALVELGLQVGPWGAASTGNGGGLSLDRLRAAPSGIDLGPLQPQLPQRLRTPDQRVHLNAALIVDAFAPAMVDIEQRAAAQPDDRLVLIGRRHVRSNNSWMHNSPRLVRGRGRSAALLHPDDAKRFDVADGGRIRVTSDVGAIEVEVIVTDDVMPGVISIPHGWGHAREGVGWSVAAAAGGASVNDVTDPTLLDDLSGNAALSETLVRIAPVAP